MTTINPEELVDELDALVKRHKLKSGDRDKYPLYITNDEFCAIFDISSATAYRWRRTGRITYQVIGNLIRYPYETLLRELKTDRIRIKGLTKVQAVERLTTYKKLLELC